ncbi:MAG: peptidylprolyl isomerase [Verrucomicrobiales bacterium]
MPVPIPFPGRAGLTLCAALALPLFAFPRLASSFDEVDGLAATVNGEPITRSEVRQAIAVRAQVEGMGRGGSRADIAAKIATFEKEALQDLIDRELILKAFAELGGVIRQQFVDDAIRKFILDRFDGDRELFIEELTNTGMSLKTFRKMRKETLIVQYMRSNQIGAIAPPTPAEREKWYSKNIDRFRDHDYIKLRTITIPKFTGDPTTKTEDQATLAKEIRTKIAEGADFGTMAKTYSEDSKRLKGGDWGTIERGDFKELLSDAAFKLEPQTVSSVLEDERNYYLLWVDAVQRGSVTPLSEIEEDVDKFVNQSKRMEAHDKWIQRLRDHATITTYSQFSQNR